MTVTARQGEVTVPVLLSGVPDLGSFQFTVQYDPEKLTLGEITDWYTGISDVTICTPVPGVITFVWAADEKGFAIHDGVLCNLHFTATTEEDASITFMNGPTPMEFSDYEGVTFDPRVVNGAVKATTGISSNDLSTLRIYPNPNNGKFTLMAGNAQGTLAVTIMDATGRVIYSNDKVTFSAAHAATIDLGNQPQGIYMIRLENADQVVTQKLIIGQ